MLWLISRGGLQAKFDSKARGHAVEGLAVDAEDFRRAFPIATRRFEDVENVAAFQFVEVRQSGKEVGEIVG